MTDQRPNEIVYGVTDFVAVLNQTLEFAYPSVIISGELANFRVSKNRWVYFDLKDEFSSVKFFGTIYMLPGPLEDGMLLQVRGQPRLHPLYGFSINAQTIQPVGEGSLRRAAALLEAKLTAEGLFDESRKRALPYPPSQVGLITSGESAAYADFIKIMAERWGGVDIKLADVQVQGEPAPTQIVRAIEYFNQHASPPEVLVITRGGGSAEDLAAFSTEQVTRAIAASRIPTLVAIGHEVDISLGEMAADQRASTPSNAAQLLVPDKKEEKVRIKTSGQQLGQSLANLVATWRANLKLSVSELQHTVVNYLKKAAHDVSSQKELLLALSPEGVLKRGYAIVRKNNTVVKRVTDLKKADTISIQLSDGNVQAKLTDITQ